MSEMDNQNKIILERLELSIGRICEISSEEMPDEKVKDYFNEVAEFILYVYDVYETVCKNKDIEIKQLEEINHNLYEDILPINYKQSYANPEYAVKMLGKDYGKLLSFLYTEIRSIIVYAYEDRMLLFVSLCELFLEIYNMFLGDENPPTKYIKETIYYHMFDYLEETIPGGIKQNLGIDNTFAVDIIMESDLENLSYLYKYGEYIGPNEIETAKFLNKLSEDKIISMAKTCTDGFVRGFTTMQIDISTKKSVNIRYSIGQERMIKEVIRLFKEKGLEPIIYRYAISRSNRKLTNRNGFIGTPANKQYEYDHRMDEAIFYDSAFASRKLEIAAITYEKYKKEALEYAGPAVIETFGESPFSPINKPENYKLSKKQQVLSVEYASKMGELVNTYIPRYKYGFTIIAYPNPEIGEDFNAIFEDVVKINTLDNDLYMQYQQQIIDELDKAKYVQIIGEGNNQTDLKVMLHELKDPSKETNFENCLADVNIPLGEVFTSPKLKGTNGTLNVSKVYLNDLEYKNLNITFRDGMVESYTCDNFESEDENKAYIKENLLFNHEALPIGEFAIGTNTVAYVMAKKYDILYKLPILIVEKMGPHFALGDTCYSHSEDNRLYNPDGKEIIAKENECSICRNHDISKAYFNCHTDITIPYEEIKGIYSVHCNDEKVAIIENGRFVLNGTNDLNKPLDDYNKNN